MGTVDRARAAAKAAIEAMHYDGTCTVTTYTETTDSTTGITSLSEVAALTSEPCHLSVNRHPSADSTDSVTNIVQEVRLFVAPSVSIPPGSKVSVTQEGVTKVFRSSGIPAVYATHQEVGLVTEERWA